MKRIFLMIAAVVLMASVSAHAQLINQYVGVRSPGGNTLIVNTDGSIDVSQLLITDFDPVNYSIPATSASGTNLNPLATSSFFILVNESTQTLRLCLACTASATTGLYIPSGASVSGDSLQLTALSVYNSGAISASVSIIYGRKP